MIYWHFLNRRPEGVYGLMEAFELAGKLGSNTETMIRARPLAGMEDKTLEKKHLYVTAKEVSYGQKGTETLLYEVLAKLLKARANRHSGQAKRDPESRIFKRFWIPAFAGMTE
jgi:hypothetical protein